MQPLSKPEAREFTAGLSEQEIREAIHCVTPEGRVYRGARAIRRVCFQLPLLVPLGLVLWIPGVIWICEGIYRLVSRNRHLLSRLFGCGAACRVLPAKPEAIEHNQLPPSRQDSLSKPAPSGPPPDNSSRTPHAGESEPRSTSDNR